VKGSVGRRKEATERAGRNGGEMERRRRKEILLEVEIESPVLTALTN